VRKKYTHYPDVIFAFPILTLPIQILGRRLHNRVWRVFCYRFGFRARGITYRSHIVSPHTSQLYLYTRQLKQLMRFLAQMCQTRSFNLYLVDRLHPSNDHQEFPFPPSLFSVTNQWKEIKSIKNRSVHFFWV